MNNSEKPKIKNLLKIVEKEENFINPLIGLMGTFNPKKEYEVVQRAILIINDIMKDNNNFKLKESEFNKDIEDWYKIKDTLILKNLIK